MKKQELLTRSEAAEFLRVSLRTFDSLAAEGHFPKYRIGKQRIVFRRNDLDAYVEDRQVECDQLPSDVAETILAL